ncbi:hypothetical protein ACH44C_23160 [Streptomyces purpureus]|uniref:hypothetical protein n=1 Tax=Streptomyces purpureus TaxID=1951 RepID=UPI0037AFBAE6
MSEAPEPTHAPGDGQTETEAETVEEYDPAEAYDPAAPAPLGVVRTPTGHPVVDAGLERLADADHLPADGHLDVYEDVHQGLRDALTALDARPEPAPPHRPSPYRPSNDNRS